MHLRDALPRFYSEAIAAIAAKPADEFLRVSRQDLLAQFEHLMVVPPVDSSSGSFSVTTEGRRGARGYLFSFDFDIPSGNVIADLDQDLQITSFEPISLSAIDDLRSQLDALSSR